MIALERDPKCFFKEDMKEQLAVVLMVVVGRDIF